MITAAHKHQASRVQSLGHLMFKSHVSVLLLRKPMSSVQAETLRDIRNRDIVCAVKMFVKWVI